MINVLLFVIAVIIFAISFPISIIYIAVDAIVGLLGRMALSIDLAGNVLLSEPFNDFIITNDGYKFGNRKETISSALGKNQRDGTLTALGENLCNLLDWLDPEHCKKSIDEKV